MVVRLYGGLKLELLGVQGTDDPKADIQYIEDDYYLSHSKSVPYSDKFYRGIARIANHPLLKLAAAALIMTVPGLAADNHSTTVNETSHNDASKYFEKYTSAEETPVVFGDVLVAEQPDEAVFNESTILQKYNVVLVDNLAHGSATLYGFDEDTHFQEVQRDENNFPVFIDNHGGIWTYNHVFGVAENAPCLNGSQGIIYGYNQIGSRGGQASLNILVDHPGLTKLGGK
jgi:hypothetical protein